MRKPYFNVRRQCWYVWFEGKQVRLFEDEAASNQLWHELCASPTLVTRSADPPLAEVIDDYLDHIQHHVEPGTFEGYRHYLTDFAEHGGRSPVSVLGSVHVMEWLDAHDKWGPSSRRGAITTIKNALNWAADEGRISRNPIRKLRRPSIPRRETTVAAVDHRRILNKTDAPFRLFLTALRHSGCRPGEVAKITMAVVDAQNGLWVFPGKTTKKTGRMRVVPLSPCLATITAILSHYRPTGPLFLNTLGKAWNRNSIRCRMRRLRVSLDLPAGTVAYSYRHTFATEGVVNGVDPVTLATILGHTSTDMILRHYGHLAGKAEYLREAAAKASKPDDHTATGPQT